MDKAFDHDNFPSWEKQCKLQQQIKNDENNKKLELLKKDKLKHQYPEIEWTQLKIQNDNYSTDDNCIHYKNTETMQVYSWYCDKKWIQHNESYQNSLMDLFD